MASSSRRDAGVQLEALGSRPWSSPVECASLAEGPEEALKALRRKAMSSIPSRQQIKDEIDGIPREHLAVLHRIVLALDNGNGASASDAATAPSNRDVKPSRAS